MLRADNLVTMFRFSRISGIRRGLYCDNRILSAIDKKKKGKKEVKKEKKKENDGARGKDRDRERNKEGTTNVKSSVIHHITCTPKFVCINRHKQYLIVHLM